MQTMFDKFSDEQVIAWLDAKVERAIARERVRCPLGSMRDDEIVMWLDERLASSLQAAANRRDACRAWYAANKDHALIYGRHYRMRNADAVREMARSWKRRNRERVNAGKRELGRFTSLLNKANRLLALQERNRLRADLRALARVASEEQKRITVARRLQYDRDKSARKRRELPRSHLLNKFTQGREIDRSLITDDQLEIYRLHILFTRTLKERQCPKN